VRRQMIFPLPQDLASHDSSLQGLPSSLSVFYENATLVPFGGWPNNGVVGPENHKRVESTDIKETEGFGCVG
jgi:hypothetical protein